MKTFLGPVQKQMWKPYLHTFLYPYCRQGNVRTYIGNTFDTKFEIQPAFPGFPAGGITCRRIDWDSLKPALGHTTVNQLYETSVAKATLVILQRNRVWAFCFHGDADFCCKQMTYKEC